MKPVQGCARVIRSARNHLEDSLNQHLPPFNRIFSDEGKAQFIVCILRSQKDTVITKKIFKKICRSLPQTIILLIAVIIQASVSTLHHKSKPWIIGCLHSTSPSPRDKGPLR